jgi:hypothetical protein
MMNNMDQNFEQADKPISFHVPVVVKPKSNKIKMLLIAIPGIVFFLMILLFLVMRENQAKLGNTVTSSEASPTPTPLPPALQKTVDTEKELNELDLNQEIVSPPQMDMNVKI